MLRSKTLTMPSLFRSAEAVEVLYLLRRMDRSKMFTEPSLFRSPILVVPPVVTVAAQVLWEPVVELVAQLESEATEACTIGKTGD
jgi:hypothetical protein